MHRHASLIAAVAVVIAGTSFVLSAHADAYIAPGFFRNQAPRLKDFLDAADKLDRSVEAVKRKTNATAQDTKQVEDHSAEVLARVRGAEQALNEMVTNLEAAGKWTAELDTYVDEAFRAKGLTALRAELKQGGGFRSVMRKRSTLEKDTKDEVTLLRARRSPSPIATLLERIGFVATLEARAIRRFLVKAPLCLTTDLGDCRN